MGTSIEFDPRIKDYEELCNIIKGKGGVVCVDPGTRIYRDHGTSWAFRLWMREVQGIFQGELIPFEWAADYIGVTRAALHGRVKNGTMTMLVFEMHEVVKGMLGKRRERMRREYKFMIKSECHSWMDLLRRQHEAKIERYRNENG